MKVLLDSSCVGEIFPGVSEATMPKSYQPDVQIPLDDWLAWAEGEDVTVKLPKTFFSSSKV